MHSVLIVPAGGQPLPRCAHNAQLTLHDWKQGLNLPVDPVAHVLLEARLSLVEFRVFSISGSQSVSLRPAAGASLGKL